MKVNTELRVLAKTMSPRRKKSGNKEKKTMKTTTIVKTSFFLLLAGGLFTACSSDDDGAKQTNVMEAGKTYTLTVTASKGSDEAAAKERRALTMDNGTIRATWAKKEQVFYRDRDWNLQYSGYLKPQSEGKTVLLNGTISSSADLVLPIDIKLIFPKKDWDYTGQVGTLSDIAANYDYATTTANITSIEAYRMDASVPVTFKNEQSIVKFTLKDNANAAVNVSSLRISAKGLVKNIDEPFGDEEFGDIIVTPANATNEVFAALRGIKNAQVTLTATVGSDYYIFKRDNVTFNNGAYKAITVKIHKINYPVSLSEVTQDHIGSVVGRNGKVYPNASAAESDGTVAEAMIVYVGTESNCTHGLAIALNDEGETIQDAAKSAAASHTAVSGGTWRLPTLTDWQYMLIGCGNGATYSNEPGTVDYTALNSKLGTVGTALHNDGRYWSSTNYFCPVFTPEGNCDMTSFDQTGGMLSVYARAVLAF